MFPITHFYLNQLIYEPSSLLAIGGVFPDIASAAGMDRAEAHQMGRALFDYCKTNHPEAIDLGRGVFLHGTTEGGADYYSDECWEGGEKGWCFQKGRDYMEEVGKATKIPEEYWWWKSHNFVELGLECITDLRYPNLKTELLMRLSDKKAQELAADILKEFANVNKKKLLRVLDDIENIFELKNVNFITLAENQRRGILKRFNVTECDTLQMSVVIKHITEDMLKNDDFDRFMPEVAKRMSRFILY